MKVVFLVTVGILLAVATGNPAVAAESDDQEANSAGDGEAAEGEAPDAPDDSAESDGASADVVTLDSFRKK